VREGSNPSRVYMDALDVAISGFPAPLNSTVDLQLNSSMTPIQGYSFYTATIQDSGYQLTLDIHSLLTNGTIYTEDFRQTSLLDNTPYVAPTNATSSTSTGTSASSSSRLAATHIVGCFALVVGMMLASL
ncbi:hypothetical protein C0991_001168, partial [Blastosporella zonata]